MRFSYEHRLVTHTDGTRADVFVTRFPADSLRFTAITLHDRLTRMRDAAHLCHCQARARGELDPVVVAWACLEQDMSVQALFPNLDAITEAGEHILSANSWITYVLRVMLSRGWLQWHSGTWEVAVSDSRPDWRDIARPVVAWLVDTDRLWLEVGSGQRRPEFLAFDDFDPLRHLVPVGRCGFVRKYALSERPRMVFNTAFFLLEHDDFVSHHSALGDPYGLSVEAGTIVRPPLYRRATIWHTREQGWRTGLVGMNDMLLVLPDGTFLYPATARGKPGLPYHINAADEYDIVVYTRSWGVAHTGRVLGRTPERPGRLEVTVVDSRVVGWKRGGGLVIPQNGFVLSFAPSVLSQKQQEALLRYSQITLGFATGELQTVDRAIQCGPRLVLDGENVLSARSLDNEEFWISRVLDGQRVVGVVPTDFPDDVDRTRAGRIGLGIDHNGDLLAVAVPGLSKNVAQTTADSVGATLKELAEYLLAAGAVQAINLDGGGSTQLFVDGGTLARQGDRRGYQRVVFDRMIPAIGVVKAVGGWRETDG